MAEPTPLEPDDRPTCSWKRGGDFCIHPVDEAGDLCPHHVKLWQQLKDEEMAKAKGQHVRDPTPEEIEATDIPLGSVEAEEPPARRVKPNGAKGGKPRKPSKYDRLRELAKRNVLATLEAGRQGGLTAQQVQVLFEALDVLGFLQEGEDR